MKQLHFQHYTMNPFFAFMFWKYNCLQTKLPHFSAVHLTKCRHVLAYVPDLHSCSSFAVTYPCVGHFSHCTAQNFSFVCCMTWLSQLSQRWRVRLEELVKKTIRTTQLLSYNVKSGGFLMSRIFFCPNCHWIVRTPWELSTMKVGLVGLVWLFNSFESILWSMQLLEDPRVDASFPPLHSSPPTFPLPHTLSCLTSKSGLQLSSGPVEVDESRALLEPRFNSNGFLTLVLVWLPSCYCCFIHKANGLTLHLKLCQRAIVNYWYQLHVNSRQA